MTRADLLGHEAQRGASGLVVVDSHVRRTTEQLARLLELPRATGIELGVARTLDAKARDVEIARVSGRATEVLRSGGTAVVYTSRTVERPDKQDELAVARSVSDALVALVRGIENRPAFVIGKGGITSSDVGTRGLGAERALVLGQVRPGVPVWRLGDESRFPGLQYVVFPGNFGAPETLAEIVTELIGRGAADT